MIRPQVGLATVILKFDGSGRITAYSAVMFEKTSRREFGVGNAGFAPYEFAWRYNVASGGGNR
jgi:hypothetical protein